MFSPDDGGLGDLPTRSQEITSHPFGGMSHKAEEHHVKPQRTSLILSSFMMTKRLTLHALKICFFFSSIFQLQLHDLLLLKTLVNRFPSQRYPQKPQRDQYS